MSQLKNLIAFLTNHFDFEYLEVLKIKNFKFISEEYCNYFFSELFEKFRNILKLDFENIRLEYEPITGFSVSDKLTFNNIVLPFINEIKFINSKLLFIEECAKPMRTLYADKNSIINFSCYDLIHKQNDRLILKLNSQIDHLLTKSLNNTFCMKVISLRYKGITSTVSELLFNKDLQRIKKYLVTHLKLDSFELDDNNMLYEFISSFINIETLKLYNITNSIKLNNINMYKIKKLSLKNVNIDINGEINLEQLNVDIDNLEYYNRDKDITERCINNIRNLISISKLNKLILTGNIISFSLILLSDKKDMKLKLKNFIINTNLMKITETSIREIIDSDTIKKQDDKNLINNNIILEKIKKDKSELSNFFNTLIRNRIEITIEYKSTKEYNDLVKFLILINVTEKTHFIKLANKSIL